MVSTGRRTLIVMRHAKAEPFAAEDELRRLTPAGRQDAAAAGRWMRERGLVPDAAWVSASTRTRETWSQVVGEIGVEVETRVEPAIYGAGPETVLDLIGETAEESETVLVLGHNPTVAYLTHMLDDGQPDQAAWTAVTEGFPPAALAIFRYSGPWSDLSVASAHLSEFHVGGTHG